MKSSKLVIEPGLSEKDYWRDLWKFRELFIVLAWRDVSVRYKQTIIGIAWALIQPLATMMIFSIVFGKIARLPSEGSIPYPLLVYAGLLPWQLFSTSMIGASNSLVLNGNLISKVYFPRLIIPTSAMVVSFIDFLISFVILILLFIWYEYIPSWHILTLPFFVLMAVLASFGIGLYITALNVKYRDFRYVIPFLVTFGLYISPVGFSSMLISNEWRLAYSLNPVVGVIDGFRWAILGGVSDIYVPGFILSWAVIFIFLWVGLNQFRKMEKSFADLI